MHDEAIAHLHGARGVRCAVERADRTRDPSPELRALLEKAETLGRMLTGQAPG